MVCLLVKCLVMYLNPVMPNCLGFPFLVQFISVQFSFYHMVDKWVGIDHGLKQGLLKFSWLSKPQQAQPKYGILTLVSTGNHSPLKMCPIKSG